MFDPSTSPELPALPGLSRMSPQAKALLQLPSNACRWPVGESWCGEPAVHGPYCHGHHLRSRDARSLMRIVEERLAARSGGTTGTVQHSNTPTLQHSNTTCRRPVWVYTVKTRG